MFIVEDNAEQTLYNNDVRNTMPNYEDESGGNTTKAIDTTGNRVFKSFDVAGNGSKTAQNPASGRTSFLLAASKESGVEQYESDDADDQSKQFYTSSVVQTSITRDNVMVVPGFSSG